MLEVLKRAIIFWYITVSIPGPHSVLVKWRGDKIHIKKIPHHIIDRVAGLLFSFTLRSQFKYDRRLGFRLGDYDLKFLLTLGRGWQIKKVIKNKSKNKWKIKRIQRTFMRIYFLKKVKSYRCWLVIFVKNLWMV